MFLNPNNFAQPQQLYLRYLNQAYYIIYVTNAPKNPSWLYRHLMSIAVPFCALLGMQPKYLVAFDT